MLADLQKNLSIDSVYQAQGKQERFNAKRAKIQQNKVWLDEHGFVLFNY